VQIRGNPKNYEGEPAIADFAFNESNRDSGYVFDSTTAFTLTDSSGRSTEDVVLGAKVSMGILLATENNVAVSRSSVADILESAGILHTDVRYDFDRAGRLYFYTASAGDGSRIHLEAQNPLTGVPGETLLLDEQSSRSSFFNAFGISADSTVSGYGRSEFLVHVQERSLNFQIGANQNQAVKIAIGCATSEALGLKNLDVTSHEAVVRTLGRVDEAAGRISSMRSGLGAMQNRLTSTMNNLNVTSTNLQDTESKIRDVDIAKETVNLALQQMLQQTGLAQLINVKAMNRNILSLLEG
jgi:flagellin-like hook-associated protein FlgL